MFNSILLGILQGLTEFLPVSSSGHLVLAEHLLGVRSRGDIAFEVFLHLGTLFSILTLFWKDIVRMIESVARAVTVPAAMKENYKHDADLRLAWYVVLGTLPAAVVGVLFEHQVESLFSDPKLVADMLIVTGVILYLTRFAHVRDNGSMNGFQSFIIGIGQAVAVIPGISRSGSTISTGMYLGVQPEEATRFSFLLAVPVIAGAALLKAKELYAAHTPIADITPMAVGAVFAYLVGILAIKFLLGVVRRGKFVWFAYYCIIAGIAGIIFL